jgi:hypothetical protein
MSNFSDQKCTFCDKQASCGVYGEQATCKSCQKAFIAGAKTESILFFERIKNLIIDHSIEEVLDIIARSH